MSSNFRADLHTHSCYSDGSDTPKELLCKAKELGLRGLAITDHDTIEAYAEALPIAKKLNIALISGIEFSASFKEQSVHILGYAFSLKSKRVAALCAKHKTRRDDRNRHILKKLKSLGIDIDPQELEAQNKGTVGRPHIAMILMQQGKVKNIKEAFVKYLGDGKSAYVPGAKISCDETIDCIKRAGGKAVLAHPHLLRRMTLARELLKLPFDGLEGYYARIPKDQEKKWVVAAKERGWLITGGSDYHGAIKPLNPLGTSWVDEKTFSLLHDHFLSHG